MLNPEILSESGIHSMTAEESALWERLQQFSLDQSEDPFPLSQRLARENSWSLQYAQHVVQEYKKFVFLAIVAGHPVTPSEQIDQVWHLHLTYTRSYWDEFCTNVLQTPLHHDPTRGGRDETQKFEDWYGRTLESYERFFEQIPPIAIWSASHDRFGKDLAVVKVNTQDNWILPKLPIKQWLSTSLGMGLTLILSGCYIDISERSTASFEDILLIIFCVLAITGMVRFLLQLIAFMKAPSLPPGSYGATSWGNSGAGTTCTSGDCDSGWSWGDFSGHSSGDSGGCSGDGGCGGGCGGCGGGGE